MVILLRSTSLFPDELIAFQALEHVRAPAQIISLSLRLVLRQHGPCMLATNLCGFRVNGGEFRRVAFAADVEGSDGLNRINQITK